MGKFIVHKDGAYNIYGTIADGCHYESALTLEQLEQVIRFEDGQRGIDELPARLMRAHATGCSGHDWSLDDCIAGNRAGPGESRLSREEFISRFLTLPDGGSR